MFPCQLCGFPSLLHLSAHQFLQEQDYTPYLSNNPTRKSPGYLNQASVEAVLGQSGRKGIFVQLFLTAIQSLHLLCVEPPHLAETIQHTYTTHCQRTEKLAILASALSFAKCASAFVTHSSSALDQLYTFVFIRRVRREFERTSTHECTRQKDARHAQSALNPTPYTRI